MVVQPLLQRLTRLWSIEPVNNLRNCCLIVSAGWFDGNWTFDRWKKTFA